MSLDTSPSAPGLPPLPVRRSTLPPSPMGVGAVVSTALDIMKRRFGLLMGLSVAQVVLGYLIMVVPVVIATFLIMGLMANSIGAYSAPGTGQIVAAVVIGIVALVVGMIGSLWVSVKYTAMHAVVTDQTARGQEPTWSSASAQTTGIGRRALAAIGYLIAIVVAVYVVAMIVAFGLAAMGSDSSPAVAILGILLLLAVEAAAIYFSVRLAYIYQILGIERLGGSAVLKRSMQLTRGRFWPTLGYSLVGSLVPVIIFAVIGGILGALGSSSSSVGNVLAVVLALVMVALVFAVSAWSVVYTTVMYIDQVRRHAAAGIPNTFAPAGGAIGQGGFGQDSFAPPVGQAPWGQQQLGAQPGAISPEFLPQGRHEQVEVDTWGQTPTGPLGGSTAAPRPVDDTPANPWGTSSGTGSKELDEPTRSFEAEPTRSFEAEPTRSFEAEPTRSFEAEPTREVPATDGPWAVQHQLQDTDQRLPQQPGQTLQPGTQQPGTQQSPGTQPSANPWGRPDEK